MSRLSRPRAPESEIDVANAPSSQIAASLETQRTEAEEARRLLAEQQASRQHLLLHGDDDDLAALDAAIAATQRRVDRARARIAHLTHALGQAQASEAEAAKQDAYDEHIARASAFLACYGAEYAKLAGALQALLAKARAIEAERNNVNINLPAGATPLESIEAASRWWPAEPERVETVTVRRAVRRDDGAPITVMVGQPIEMENVEVERVVPAKPVRRVPTLWADFKLPGFRPDDPAYRV